MSAFIALREGIYKIIGFRIGNDCAYAAVIIGYEDCGGNGCTPQYNGNISRMTHELAHDNTDFTQYRDVAYAYDQLNRLTKTDDMVQDYFDEIFAYDPQGRMTAQRRDTSVIKNVGGEYSYYENTNKLPCTESAGFCMSYADG